MRQNTAIDLEHLDRYVSGDRVLRDEILSIFEQQAEMWMRLLDPNAEDKSWRDAAHALKGASRGIGAWEVGELCEEAEDLTGDEVKDRVRRSVLLEELRQRILETVEEVRQLRNAH